MNRFEKLGLGIMTESEEYFTGAVKDTCANGRVKVGYYGEPYINHYWGDPQLVARIHRNDEKKQLEFHGLDVHVIGNCVWEFEISGMDFQPRSADRLERRVIARKTDDGGGMAVVNLVNADVLPSFLEGDRVKAQMVGFAEFVSYYENEDEYSDAMSALTDEDDRPMLLGDGTVFPAGIFANHSLGNETEEEDPYSDNICYIRGTVKRICLGEVKLGKGEPINPYYTVTIGTQYGDLDIVHTNEQIAEGSRKKFKVGDIAVGGFYLSGDVAIDEYDDGIVKDEANALSLVRYTIIKGDAERMRILLNSESIYVSEHSDGAIFKGADEIIDRFNYVRSSDPEGKIYGYYATLTEDNEHLPYGNGKRCVVLSYDEPDDFSSILFVDTDDSGDISKITVSIDPRYRFKIDDKPERKNILDSFKPPETVADPIITRARFHGYIDEDTDRESIVGFNQHYEYFEAQADGIIDMLRSIPEEKKNGSLENAFGYLFAKAMAYDFVLRSEETSITAEAFESLEGVFNDGFEISVEGIDKKLKRAYKYGRQFFKDYDIYKSAVNEDADDILYDALILVQQIAVIYSRKRLIQ